MWCVSCFQGLPLVGRLGRGGRSERPRLTEPPPHVSFRRQPAGIAQSLACEAAQVHFKAEDRRPIEEHPDGGSQPDAACAAPSDDAFETCWPDLQELKQLPSKLFDGTAVRQCSLCRGAIFGIAFEAPRGGALHYGCACVL